MLPIVAFVKRSWKWLVGGLAAVVLLVAYVLGLGKRRQPIRVDDVKEITDAADRTHKVVVDAISEERRAKDENDNNLKRTLESIEKRHAEDGKKLTDDKRREVERIVQEHGNDPDALADLLSKATGIKIVK